MRISSKDTAKGEFGKDKDKGSDKDKGEDFPTGKGKHTAKGGVAWPLVLALC